MKILYLHNDQPEILNQALQEQIEAYDLFIRGFQTAGDMLERVKHERDVLAHIVKQLLGVR